MSESRLPIHKTRYVVLNKFPDFLHLMSFVGEGGGMLSHQCWCERDWDSSRRWIIMLCSWAKNKCLIAPISTKEWECVTVNCKRDFRGNDGKLQCTSHQGCIRIVIFMVTHDMLWHPRQPLALQATYPIQETDTLQLTNKDWWTCIVVIHRISEVYLELHITHLLIIQCSYQHAINLFFLHMLGFYTLWP